MMRWYVIALAALVASCTSAPAAPTPVVPTPAPSEVSASSAAASLSPLSISTDVPAVKSSGRVVSIQGRFALIRVDQGNGIALRALDNALISLRTDEQTAFTRFDSGPLLGLGPTSLADIPIGDRITFMFQPSSYDPADHAYLARVIGH